MNYNVYIKLCENIEKFLRKLYYDYYVFLQAVQGIQNQPKKIKKYEYVVNKYN
jgi:hypothetical protein